jgi:hypothetical protein
MFKRYFLFLAMIASFAMIPVACSSDDGGPEPPETENPTPDPTNANTTITADPATITADGTATSTVTVNIADSNGDLLTASAGTVALVSSSSSTTISSVTDNSDGSYTATVSDTVAGTVTISGTLNDAAITDTAEIVFEADTTGTAADPDPTSANTTIEASATELVNDTLTSTVTVQIADTNGDLLTTSGGTVTLATTGSATVSDVTDNEDGTYTATVTNTVEETVTISGTLNEVAITDTAEIMFGTEGEAANPATEVEQSTEEAGPSLLRINSGGEEVTFGDITFLADQYFTGPSVAYTNPLVTEIAGTDMDAIYLTERITEDGSPAGPFSYEIPVTEGTYTVKLHFAEIYWGVENPDGFEGDVGKRIFNISMEGTPIFTEYDLFKDVGAATADQRMYDIEVTDGVLNITFEASVDRPKVSAIEIFGTGTIGG